MLEDSAVDFEGYFQRKFEYQLTHPNWWKDRPLTRKRQRLHVRQHPELREPRTCPECGREYDDENEGL